MRNFLLILASLVCMVIGIVLAYIERDGFGIGPEYFFILIPEVIDYIWEYLESENTWK